MKYNQLPEDTKLFLKSQINSPSADDCQKSFLYSILMFWQSRYSKLEKDSKTHYDIISSIYMPEGFKYLGINNDPKIVSETVKFKHMSLALDIFNQLHKSLYPEVYEKKSFIHKIIKRLKLK